MTEIILSLTINAYISFLLVGTFLLYHILDFLVYMKIKLFHKDKLNIIVKLSEEKIAIKLSETPIMYTIEVVSRIVFQLFFLYLAGVCLYQYALSL